MPPHAHTVRSPTPEFVAEMTTTTSRVAPNGLPYPEHSEGRTVAAGDTNTWSRRSPFLARLPLDPVRSTHPFVVAQPRDGIGGGMGLFVYMGIRKGEIVWAERANAGGLTTAHPRSRQWIDALPPAARKAYLHFMYKTGEDEFQSLAEFNDVPPERFPEVRTVDISNYMNHSCEPTCWFVDGGEGFEAMMVATRDLIPGDELTYDYCTSEDCELAGSWKCACGAAGCRGEVTPEDWRRPELQARYHGHFQPHIAERIAHEAAAGGEGGGAAAQPLEPLGGGVSKEATWWLRLQDEPSVGLSPAQQPQNLKALPADRQQLIARGATGSALELINRQAAALISHNRLRVLTNERVGRFIEAGQDIPAGELVMLLPPNLLLWDEEVTDYNKVVQIATTKGGGRLFSSSLHEHDLDNFICHSCEPNCAVHVGEDLGAALVAIKTIRAGESVCFDYDSTEDDLRDHKGGFECECGTARCRKKVLGRHHSPAPELLPAPAALAA